MTANSHSLDFRLSDPVHFLALGFGSGLEPKAPGTFGTLAAIPVYLLMASFTVKYYAAVVAIMVHGALADVVPRTAW